MNPKNTHKSINQLITCSLTLTTLLIALAISSQAQASRVLTEGVDYSEALYEEKIEDLRVKVLGGYLRITRHYSEGQWHINRRWSDLILLDRDNQIIDGSGHTTLWQIERADYRYQRQHRHLRPHHPQQRRTGHRTLV